MFERNVRLASEALARNMSRRTFLRRTGSVVVTGVTAAVMGSLLPKGTTRVEADNVKPSIPDISCAPPGPYCNIGTGDLSGCHGGHCFQHLFNGQIYACNVYYAFYPAGCWTTASGGGYWTCCDCSCGQPRVTSCGCAQFTLTPAALAE